MCTEPVTLIPLMKGCQQATLIGDHNQLPAVVLVRVFRLVTALSPSHFRLVRRVPGRSKSAFTRACSSG